MEFLVLVFCRVTVLSLFVTSAHVFFFRAQVFSIFVKCHEINIILCISQQVTDTSVKNDFELNKLRKLIMILS